MKRRDFGRALAAGSIGAVAANCEKPATVTENTTAKPQPKKVLMHVGCQSGGTSVENLQFKTRHGVNNIDGGEPTLIPGKGWDLNEVLDMKERCEKYGVSLDAFHLPLSSAGIDRVPLPNIMLGKSPERDREIEIVQQMIEVTSRANIRLLNYNLIILPVLRTGRTPGRGGSTYSTWELAKALDAPLSKAGEVSAEEMWNRITYFLERVIPVAEEHKVQMGCHLPDPPTPPGYRGITRVLGMPNAEGLKRFIEIIDSPYHGFNFCMGSFAEGLENPSVEIYDHVRYFGERKKIFNVHFRNIIGKRDNFQEVYPDNGDIDMLKLARTLQEVKYPYMLMPDHVPQHPDDPGGSQAFAFCYGYIKSVIQAVKDET
ncbi:MAG TPA: mannonate dehydratase [Anaerolineae bacterium]|nr:mannonate dehydratase [Anaerolineae bacterium]